jgi:hypothetical protein
MTDVTPAPEAESIEQILDGQESPVVDEVQAETPQATPEAQQPETKPGAEQPFWYRKQIEKERKERQRLERELEQARKSVPQYELPDARQDPVSYFETQRVIDRLERSEDRFIDKHSEQEFDLVKEWLTTRPDIEAWAVQQRHPWGAAYQQYQREKLSTEIGDDPNAWREKERERLRQEILAELPAASMALQRPNLPPPASGQRSTASRSGPAFAGPTPLGNILKG